MSVARLSSSYSYNSSLSSSQLDKQEDAATMTVKNICKDTLKSRIFLGRYIERRLADKRIGYRDVILISPAEVELKKDLLDVQNKLLTVCPMQWIGITDTETLGHRTSGVCLWTEIDNQPFGPFWFQIKSLKFREYEVIVSLKCLRHISDAFIEIEPILTGAVTKLKANEITDNNKTKLEDSAATLNETCKDFVDTLKGVLSISNVKEFITFLFAFIIAIFTGSTSFVNFLGNFILALIREMSGLVKSSTPMFLGILDFFSKIIGGFYILLAMLFKQSAPIPTSKRTIGYYDRPQNRHSRYDDGHFD